MSGSLKVWGGTAQGAHGIPSQISTGVLGSPKAAKLLAKRGLEEPFGLSGYENTETEVNKN